MSSTSATTNSSPSGPPRRRPTLVVWPFVVGTLVCCAWFVGGSELWAIDLDENLRSQQRDEAARDLKRASENVEKVRALAVSARERLDAFLSRHFERQRRGPPAARPPEADVDAVVGPKAELERLDTRLLELREHRQELLGYLTDEHPQVSDVEGRIAVLEQRMANLGDVPLEADGRTGRQTAVAEKWWAEYARSVARQADEDSAAYQRLYDGWRSAERAADDALQAERAASERLVAITLPEPQLVESAPNEKPSLDSPRDVPAHEPKDSAASQPLALVALLIALAVAALAAVRLARSTANPIFASVDEAAAALAIPVVGIIPATAARVPRASSAGSPRRSALILLGQVFVAGFAFAAVALAVQNPSAFWRLCTHPLETLGLILRAVSGG